MHMTQLPIAEKADAFPNTSMKPLVKPINPTGKGRQECEQDRPKILGRALWHLDLCLDNKHGQHWKIEVLGPRWNIDPVMAASTSLFGGSLGIYLINVIQTINHPPNHHVQKGGKNYSQSWVVYGIVLTTLRLLTIIRAIIIKLVGGLVAIFYFPIYWVAFIIPIDELIFFRATNNQ